MCDRQVFGDAESDRHIDVRRGIVDRQSIGQEELSDRRAIDAGRVDAVVVPIARDRQISRRAEINGYYSAAERRIDDREVGNADFPDAARE